MTEDTPSENKKAEANNKKPGSAEQYAGSSQGKLLQNPGTLGNQLSVSKKEEQEGVYVHFAGIVLIHPFFPSFLKNLRLLEKGQWTSKEAQYKAVQLLAYMCKGKLFCPEHECLLFKHICALPWSTVIASDLDLSKSEMEEADDVVSSVIKHWTALKNTTQEGLREGFFNRAGKLWREESGWQLHIEQKGQDILLQQLPLEFRRNKISMVEGRDLAKLDLIKRTDLILNP